VIIGAISSNWLGFQELSRVRKKSDTSSIDVGLSLVGVACGSEVETDSETSIHFLICNSTSIGDASLSFSVQYQ
jgi:hypothetical protein